MDALILDFDGVVVDSEPIHLMGFQQVLATIGIDLSEADYYRLYLGYDDHDCLAVAGRNAGIALDEARIDELTAAKTAIVQRALAESVRPLPGAVELIRAADDAGVPVAICSGALREEIDLACRTIGVADCIRTIVAAKDVRRGKPDPEGYLLTLSKLREPPAAAPGRADRCVVIEDSPAGIDAAKAAGMKVLAVTNSYTADRLADADRIVESLAGIAPANLDELI